MRLGRISYLQATIQATARRLCDNCLNRPLTEVHPPSVRFNGRRRPRQAVLPSTSSHPVLDSISPSSGPYEGNTTVKFHGASFVNTASNSELRCRFGAYEVPGTFSSNEVVSCIAPSSDLAGASADFTGMAFDHTGLNFDDPNLKLLGSANALTGFAEPTGHPLIKERMKVLALSFYRQSTRRISARQRARLWFDASFVFRMGLAPRMV